jgi:hypothetical protein
VSLQARIQDDLKAAMRARDSAQVGALRLLTAALKQVEVDERAELTDARVLAVLEKQLKQRRDAHDQYRKAGREDLAAREAYEIGLIERYLPQPLDEEALDALIGEAIAETGAASMRDMGRVMALVKERAAGRADMAAASARVKARLG